MDFANTILPILFFIFVFFVFSFVILARDLHKIRKQLKGKESEML